jgi:hypothetical protein
VLQLGGNACFIGEASRGRGVSAEFVAQDFKSDFPIQDAVGGAIDDSHPTVGEFAFQKVSLGRGGQPLRFDRITPSGTRDGRIVREGDCDGTVGRKRQLGGGMLIGRRYRH